MNACLRIRQPMSRRNGATNGVPSSAVGTGATTDSYAPFTISLSHTYRDQSGLISGLKVPITASSTLHDAAAAKP